MSHKHSWHLYLFNVLNILTDGGTCAFVELRCNQEDLKKFQDDLIRNLKLSVEKVDQKYPAEAVPRMFIVGFLYMYIILLLLKLYFYCFYRICVL